MLTGNLDCLTTAKLLSLAESITGKQQEQPETYYLLDDRRHERAG